MMKVAISLLALAVLAGCACNPSNPANPAPMAYAVAPPPCPSPCPTEPMMMASPEDVAKCGSLPAEAKPGEVWCCVPYSIPSAPQRVCVQQECERRIEIPAVYETRSEQVMVAPARVEWQKVPCESSGSDDCWKLVEIPAVYESRCEQCVVQPASYRVERTPAVFEEVYGDPITGYRWEHRKDCEVPMAPAEFPAPPTGSID